MTVVLDPKSNEYNVAFRLNKKMGEHIYIFDVILTNLNLAQTMLVGTSVVKLMANNKNSTKINILKTISEDNETMEMLKREALRQAKELDEILN